MCLVQALMGTSWGFEFRVVTGGNRITKIVGRKRFDERHRHSGGAECPLWWCTKHGLESPEIIESETNYALMQFPLSFNPNPIP
jgi:hypothetical protein